MKLSAVGPAAVLIVLACSDAPNAQHAVPTAPAGAVVSSSSARTTVCLAYDGELQQGQARLLKSPEDAVLQARLHSLQAIIADVCN